MDLSDQSDQDAPDDIDIPDLVPHSPVMEARPIAEPSILPNLSFYNEEVNAENLSSMGTLDVRLVWQKWLRIVDSLVEKDEERVFQMLLEYWLKVVPHVYTLEQSQDCLNTFNNAEVQDAAQKYLLEPLARFLTNGKAGAEDMINYLTLSDQPPTVCGRVFQVGEATYSCRECGMDPTCVLCAECFKSSAHKHHKYKIATSAGGGYCDCGDPEAWKNFVHCQHHLPRPGAVTEAQIMTAAAAAPGANLDDELSPLTPEQQAFAHRAKTILPQILLYAYELTAGDLDRYLPRCFKLNQKEEIEKSSLFATVLYNDETHTFDLVIQTLTRALQCTKKDAIEYATTIDREGRSIVKVGEFTPCHEAQRIIERSTAGRSPNTKPLKCSVMTREVVQNQQFALQLLWWLESLSGHSITLRKVIQDTFYCQGVELFKNNGVCNDSSRTRWLIDSVLRSDTRLWKSARSAWHRLVISSLLKEYASKKIFAEVFTIEYAGIMDDFIRDDHEHSYSITSLSVQIFTVPSIAQYLVEGMDILFTILRVVLAQCEPRLNINGRLEFDRAAIVATNFKRTNFAILDLKYILTNPPVHWSSLMVKNFTHGIDSFLKFLSYMQEMDSVTRQVGQHMEYEPEWESAFNLHIKLQPVVQLSLEWCGLNKPVFVRAFRRCLSDLFTAYHNLSAQTVTLELANHATTCYVYDVASQPVSVHLPLTRYFAGLYLHLQFFGLDFNSSEFNLLKTDKPSAEMIMEAALRTQVLVAQVNASMWKRNGYALLNQLYFYHNVRCRADMLDKDIITLQIAASIIESNEFLLHVINRFGIYNWINTGFDEKPLKSEGQEDDLSRFLGTLTEEMLGLLITLVSARFTPGVGQVNRADAVKKEVIQQLCIEPMTHSTLNKSLVENVNLETGLELVIRDVANQKDPTAQRSAVVYELKPELYPSYDLYHYHYTREDMSKAEECQRARKKAAGEPEIFPPPHLPPFTQCFDMLVNFLQCDVFLYVIWLILNKSLEKSNRTVTESLVRKALHLIGHGLNEEIARNIRDGGFHYFQFIQNAERHRIFELLDKMLQEPSLSHHHPMILWCKQQINLVRPPTSDQEMEPTLVVQPDEEEAKKRKAQRSMEAKAKMMATMAAAQQKFMTINKDLFSEEIGDENESSGEEYEIPPVDTVALGAKQSCLPSPDEKFVCILCQEEQSLSVGTRPFVLACFVQRTTVMSQYREKILELATEDNPHDKDSLLEDCNPLYVNPNMNSANVITTCGHIMHETCWSGHIETITNKERRRPYRLRHPLSFDVDKNEWLCPMCECLCNNALLMTPHLSKVYPGPIFTHPYVGDFGISSGITSPKTTTTPTEPDPQQSTVNSVLFNAWVEGMQVIVKQRKPAEDNSVMETSESYKATAQTIFGSNPMENILFHLESASMTKVLEEAEKEPGQQFGLMFPAKCTSSSASAFYNDDPAYKVGHAEFAHHITELETLICKTGYAIDAINRKDFRLSVALLHCLSTTIIASEEFHRDQKLPFFGEDIPLRRSIGIKYLARACAILSSTPNPEMDFVIRNLRNIGIRCLTALLQNPGSTPCLFEVDAFSMLITLTFTMPTLFVSNVGGEEEEGDEELKLVGDDGNDHYVNIHALPPTGSIADHNILRLIFMYHISQILLSNDFFHCVKRPNGKNRPLQSPERISTSEKPEKSEFAGVLNEATGDFEIDCEESDGEQTTPATKRFLSRKECIFGEVWRISRKYKIGKDTMENVDCDAVWDMIKEASIPFLRCCAKFYESLTGISPPPELWSAQSSFEALTKYLDLPTEFDELFDSPFAWQMPYKWASHPETWKILDSKLPLRGINFHPEDTIDEWDYLPENIPFCYPRKLPSLAILPIDYTELINMVSNFTCKNSKTLESRTPTMCLICGIILCSQSYCCQRELKPNVVVGASIYHAHFCGGGVGIFLRIRECKLFLTNGQNRGCYLPPPYLDEYGEPDPGLRRGNPLKLSREKYETLRKLWLQNAIPGEIARVTEQNNASIATDWQFL